MVSGDDEIGRNDVWLHSIVCPIIIKSYWVALQPLHLCQSSFGIMEVEAVQLIAN